MPPSIFILALLAAAPVLAMDCVVGWTRALPYANARFLVQPSYGYKNNQDFTLQMSLAISMAESNMEMKKLRKEEAKPSDLVQWMDEIAEARGEIAAQANTPMAHRYGKHLPRDEHQIDASLKKAKPTQGAHLPGFWGISSKMERQGIREPRGIEPLLTERTGDSRMIDNLTPTNRHAPYLEKTFAEMTRRAEKATEESPYPDLKKEYFLELRDGIEKNLTAEHENSTGQAPNEVEKKSLLEKAGELASEELQRRKLRFTGFVEVSGKKIPLSYITAITDRTTGKPIEMSIVHPPPEDQIILRKEAFRILTDVHNDATISEKDARDKMAHAYFILMHATPYENGTPSIVESFLDAMIRNKFGKTIAPFKHEEPFWKVMTWDINEKPFTGDDLFSCWKTRPPKKPLDTSEN